MSGDRPKALDEPAEKITFTEDDRYRDEPEQPRETEYRFKIHGDLTFTGEFMAVLDHLCADDEKFGRILSANELITLLRSQANIIEAGLSDDI